MEQTFNWKGLLITLGIVIVTAGAVGGSTYYVMGEQAKKDKAETDKQIAALEKQVSELKTGTDETVQGSVKSKNYTNNYFKYSMSIPETWTASFNTLEQEATEESKNSIIIFKENGTEKMRILAQTWDIFPEINIENYARVSVTPTDKATVTGQVAYNIGSYPGVKETVSISDPASNGLWYFTHVGSYFYTFITSETTQSSETANVLKSFKVN